MSKKRKVRPSVQGHPNHRQSVRPFSRHPDPVTQAVLEAAEAIFLERGGVRKQRMLKLYEDTMDVYERDVALAKSDHEGFKWRVRPNELMRLRREIDLVEAEIEKLREECFQIANELTRQMMGAQEQLASQPQTQHGPVPQHEPAMEERKEAGTKRPTETAQRAAG